MTLSHFQITSWVAPLFLTFSAVLAAMCLYLTYVDTRMYWRADKAHPHRIHPNKT